MKKIIIVACVFLASGSVAFAGKGPKKPPTVEVAGDVMSITGPVSQIQLKQLADFLYPEDSGINSTWSRAEATISCQTSLESKKVIECTIVRKPDEEGGAYGEGEDDEGSERPVRVSPR